MKSALLRPAGSQRHSLRNHTLLAPLSWHQGHRFQDLLVDPAIHGNLIGAIQRFRGKSYLADGALRAGQLTADGRHCQPIDDNSWHLVVQDDLGQIISCARYHPISKPQFETTVASKSALAGSPEWRAKVKGAVESSIRQASARGASFAELGGWCVAKASRNTSEAFRSVLCMYALCEILGGAVGVSTATTRHASSSILQRMGAQKAALNGEVLPSYFEPMFDCEMDLLQFDSLRPAKRYAHHVAEYRTRMKAEVRVICCEPAPAAYPAARAALPGALLSSPQLDTGLLIQ